ncbi:thrombospondin type 3 repeat-containing protein [Polyangium aurulentum]|uniref:thrombospondin type 3 repeat-containing protein n=1 Tax=Polyangium aurulentum TaxID=2567896 RepID=UPI0010AEC3DE|nr:thrombospondin type 3 repeat-containing protein [Polyangium aurulentum]UQA58855.1 hypothetical protein E8A73_047830 [Polyangium aurulentum]
MRSRQAWVRIVALSVGVFATGSSWAQNATDKVRTLKEGVRIDQLQPASPESPFLRALGPHEKGANTIDFAVGLSLDYGFGLLRAVSVDKVTGEQIKATTVEHGLLAHVGGSLTPLPWLTVDLALPVGLYVSGLEANQVVYGETIPAPLGQGIGDLRAGLHFRPLARRSLSLILGGRFWAPFGSKDAYLSDGRYRVEADVAVAGEVGKFRYGCTISVAPQIFLMRDGDRAALACAAQGRVASFLWLGLEPSVALYSQVPSVGDAFLGVGVEPMGAARFSFGGFELGLAAGPGFGGAPATPGVRAVLSLAYVGGGRPEPSTEGPPDRDLDKIPDADDACPDEAGPNSKSAKERGCPSHDKDGDGVHDKEDACPQSPGIRHADASASGCPDVDNDTLPEPVDQCPSEPGGAPSGCPTYARIAGDSFVIKPPIKFQGNTDTLSPEGRAALEEIAATMRANPKLEQVSVSLGTRGASAALADKRAQQIILTLRGGSLDSNRYEVVLRDDLKAGTVQARIIK